WGRLRGVRSADGEGGPGEVGGVGASPFEARVPVAWYDVGVSEQVSSRAGQEDVRLRIPELAGKARLRRLLLLAGLVALVGAGLAYYFRPRPPEEVFRTFPAQRRTLV